MTHIISTALHDSVAIEVLVAKIHTSLQSWSIEFGVVKAMEIERKLVLFILRHQWPAI